MNNVLHKALLTIVVLCCIFLLIFCPWVPKHKCWLEGDNCYNVGNSAACVACSVHTPALSVFVHTSFLFIYLFFLYKPSGYLHVSKGTFQLCCWNTQYCYCAFFFVYHVVIVCHVWIISLVFCFYSTASAF